MTRIAKLTHLHQLAVEEGIRIDRALILELLVPALLSQLSASSIARDRSPRYRNLKLFHF